MKIEDAIVPEIFKNIDLSSEQVRTIKSKFEKVTVKKGTILLKAGDKVMYQYYVFDGCLRAFYADDHAKEHTIQFAIKDWWISDFTAVFNGDNAIMNIEILQDAVLYKISRNDMNTLFKEIAPLNTFFRVKLENAFANFHKRILESLSQPAKERYTSFIQKYPTIQKNVKNYHIASYLGITTESLSRIRKELANN